MDITDSFLSICQIRYSRLRRAIKGSERSSPISGEFRLHKATNQMTLITAGSWLQLAGGKLPYVGQSKACWRGEPSSRLCGRRSDGGWSYWSFWSGEKTWAMMDVSIKWLCWRLCLSNPNRLLWGNSQKPKNARFCEESWNYIDETTDVQDTLWMRTTPGIRS